MIHVFFVVLFCANLVAAHWKAPAETVTNSLFHKKCNLQRLQFDDLPTSYHSLLDRLQHIDTPVVIEGVLSSALEKWSNQSHFLETFGHLLLPRNIVTNTSLDVAQGW